MLTWLKKLFAKEKDMVKPLVSDEVCIQRLCINEGLKTEPYRCSAGKLTTGIGRNLDDNPLTAEEKAFVGHNGRSKPITNEQAFYLCRNDLKRIRKELDMYFPWWRDLDIERQFVMIDLDFNMGSATLQTFKKTLNSIATGYYIKAGEQLLQSRYARQVGIRAERNAYCLKTGEWVVNPPKQGV